MVHGAYGPLTLQGEGHSFLQNVGNRRRLGSSNTPLSKHENSQLPSYCGDAIVGKPGKITFPLIFSFYIFVVLVTVASFLSTF